LRTIWETLGWSGLSPAEQATGIAGGAMGALATIWTYALFGGRHLPRRKARKGRRR
jgi:hypothetical protein